LKTSSILPTVPAKYPKWLDELFLRFAVIYEGRWTSTIQDPRMLELKKAEWYETLQDFDAEIIMETVAYVKKLPAEKDRPRYPDIHEFHTIALGKAKLRKAREEMEARERRQAEGKILEHKGDLELAEKARAEIRRLFRLKSVNPDKQRT
jgi:hypothetical protein